MAPKAEKEFTMEEVSKHNTQDDCWLVIGNETNGELVLAAASHDRQKRGHSYRESPENIYFVHSVAVRCGAVWEGGPKETAVLRVGSGWSGVGRICLACVAYLRF